MTSSRPRLPILAALGFWLSAVAATAAAIDFDISAQPAALALQAFSQRVGAQVVFNADEVKHVAANEVKGTYEPAQALAHMLRGTGFFARQRDARLFVVLKEKGANAVVRGSLLDAGGRPLADALVVLRGAGFNVTTNAAGEFIFAGIEAGTYVIVATAAGYQPLHITDVVVQTNSDLALSRQTMRKAAATDDLTKFEPFVVKAESVTSLGEFEVSSSKAKAFSGNMDIARTINDAQPYYIFDAATIAQSGATNAADFLKQRLTMNTVALSNSQISGLNTSGNTSTVNLRGLGADKTLVLVNGRRMAGVSISTGTALMSAQGQPDINGIPLSAIERIEVLPSSASGIYGAGALGGVVNIILKQDYRGGSISTRFSSPTDTDAGMRQASFTYGSSLERGRTRVMFTGSWSKTHTYTLADRREIMDRNVARILANSPTFLYSSSAPFLGALTNIGASTTLVLKNGTSLGSAFTSIPAGFSSTASADLSAALLSRAGQFDFTLPQSTQSPTGLLREFGATPETKSFLAHFSRQMTPNIEFFADASYAGNETLSIFNPFNSFFIPSSYASNPFNNSVTVRIVSRDAVPMLTRSITRGVSTGFNAKLPWGWTGEIDYSWSSNHYTYAYLSQDVTLVGNDLASGALNPFVDTSAFPLALSKYLFPIDFRGTTHLQSVALRGTGPLPSLPWGQPQLTAGLELRRTNSEDNYQRSLNTLRPDASTYSIVHYYPAAQLATATYAETLVPLVKTGRFPGLHGLSLQASGRIERFEADTGTIGDSLSATGVRTFLGTTVNGQFYRDTASYDSKNYTIGIKYEPVRDIVVRASQASAFVPPTASQLLVNPTPSVSTTTVTDPATGASYIVSTVGGGNPALVPASSRSKNVGVIWEPRWGWLQGLRANVEYYRIQQFNQITSLSAQQIVSNESSFPGRVTRDSSGRITQVDTSLVNLFKSDTTGWDVSLSYTRRTPVGTFTFSGVESIIDELRTQYSLTSGDYDAVDFPSEGGATKYKSNLSLFWSWRRFNAGWTASYFSSYKQQGAAGGPIATQRAAAGRTPFTTYTAAQGSDTIPSQTYHDVYVGYTFGHRKTDGERPNRWRAALLDDLTLQIGVKNVFNTLPPFDASFDTNYYTSPYGDTLLRSFWVGLEKKF